MLLELLFAGPRQGADLRAPGGDVPQDGAESFEALLAGETGKVAERSAMRGKPEAGGKSADAAPQEPGTQTPLASELKQLTITADEAEISPDSTSAPAIPVDEVEALSADAAPLPVSTELESMEPDAGESSDASTPAPVLTPVPEVKPDTGENAVKADTGTEAPAAPLAPQPTPPADTPDAEISGDSAARNDASSPKAAPVRNEASFNIAAAQARAGTATLAQTPAPQGQPAPAPSAPSAPMPITAEAAAEPGLDLDAAKLARNELLAARASMSDGSETRLAAFARREMSASRLETGERAGFADAAKPGDSAKLDLAAMARPASPQTQPALPAANLQVQPPMNPAQLAQSGLAALLSSQTGQTQPSLDALTQTAGSDTGEIRLETGQQVLPRTESAAAQAARAGAPLNMRLAAGQMPAIAQLIAKRFGEGGRSFDIRLDPAELGRVHVRLEIGADRTVQAMLTAEKPEALQELQRNARELERALADAGLELGESGIGFALFDGSQDHDSPSGGSRSAANDAEPEAARLTLEPQRPDAAIERFGFTLAARGGVDVRI